MATIDTGELQGLVVENLPPLITAKSFLSRLGAGEVGKDVDKLYRNDPGFVHAIDEGDDKPVVPSSSKTFTVHKKTLVGYTDRVTKQLLNKADGAELAADLVAGLGATIPAAADVVTFHGRNPGTGTLFTSFDSVVNSTDKHFYQGAGTVQDVLDAAKAAQLRAKGMAVADSAFGYLANLRVDLTGQFQYPGIDPDAGFRYGNLLTVASPQVSWPGKEGVGTETDILAGVGDFSVIGRAIGGVDVEEFNSGDPDGVGRDLGRRNEYVWRIETDYFTVITRENAFAIAHSGTEA